MSSLYYIECCSKIVCTFGVTDCMPVPASQRVACPSPPTVPLGYRTVGYRQSAGKIDDDDDDDQKRTVTTLGGQRTTLVHSQLQARHSIEDGSQVQPLISCRWLKDPLLYFAFEIRNTYQVNSIFEKFWIVQFYYQVLLVAMNLQAVLQEIL
jgi:hypothetical protein